MRSRNLLLMTALGLTGALASTAWVARRLADSDSAPRGPASRGESSSPDFWFMLTDVQKRLVGPKLKAAPGQTWQARFNHLVRQGCTDDATCVRSFRCVLNFLSATDAHAGGPLWAAIRSIDGVWPTLLEIQVEKREPFAQAARGKDFWVNHPLERQGVHRADSFRERTDRPGDPQLHFSNDDPSRPLTYWAHWDRRSVWYKHKRPDAWIALTGRAGALSGAELAQVRAALGSDSKDAYAAPEVVQASLERQKRYRP